MSLFFSILGGQLLGWIIGIELPGSIRWAKQVINKPESEDERTERVKKANDAKFAKSVSMF